MRKVRLVLAVLFIIFLYVGCDFSDPSDSKLVGLVLRGYQPRRSPLHSGGVDPATLAYSARHSQRPMVYFDRGPAGKGRDGHLQWQHDDRDEHGCHE